MLNKKQIELLTKSNKTLAIMGLFRSGDEEKRYVFNNSGEKDGKISVPDLFAKLQPELRSSNKGTLKIGDTIFNQYELDTPLNEGENGNPQPILFDSPLLDGTIYTGEEAQGIQEQGKEVVKQLIESLDTVAYFTESYFTKSLLKIAKHYVLEEANENLKEKIAEDAQWHKTLYSDQSFCSRIVQYLTAHEQDESAIETAFQLALKSMNNGSDKRTYTDEQVEQLTEALIRCKRVMLDGTEQDVTWQKIAKSSQFNWLKNYATDPDYRLTHTQVGRKVGDKSFLAYYNVFMEASDKIHRLVRTQAIHSSIFCWLASKYRKWDIGTRVEAATEMYKIGVEEQGERRIRGESNEARFRNLELIREVMVDDQITEEIGSDDNYEMFAEKAQDNIFTALLPDRAVTKKALRLRAKNTFKKLYQIAGGKAGQILRENDEFNQLFIKYYQLILNTEPDKKTGELTIKQFAERLEKQAGRDTEAEKFTNLEMKVFVQEVIEGVEVAEDDENLIIKVKESFIRQYAQKSKNRFAQQYLENQAQIKQEEQLAEDLYDLRSMQEVSSQGETAGGAVYVVTDLAMPDFENTNEERKTARKQNLQQQAGGAIKKSLIDSVIAPKPAKFAQETGSSLDVTNEEGEKYGRVEILEDKIKFVADDVKIADKFNSADAKIVDISVTDDEGETSTVDLNIVDLNIPELADFPKKEELEKAQHIENIAQNHYQQLSKSMNTILDKYCDDESSEKDFNRSFRSLLLCEYIQAAPKGTTQLGRDDLSNILGLMVDIVEHIGELDDSKILDGVMSEDPELKMLLQKINLSKYYPAEKSEEISTILQYHYELCKKLNNVKSYLQEVAELKSFFEIIQRTDLEIVILNSTVQEYVEDYELETFTFNVDCPSLVYLTHQCRANADSLSVMSQTLAELINFPDNATNLQVPLFVSSEVLPKDTIPLPLICPSNKFELPNLIFEGSESPAKDKLNINVDWKQPQNTYLLMSAATMLLDSSIVMGAITKFKPPVMMKIRKLFNINIKKNQTVVNLFRQFWLSPDCKLLDTLIFTKWLNLVILAKRVDNSIDIQKLFGKVLGNEIWKPTEDNLSNISTASFSTIKELQNITARVCPKGKLETFEGQSDKDLSITTPYGAILEGGTKYILDVPWVEVFAEQLETNASDEDA